MTLSFALPDWLPWWGPLVVLIPVLLYLIVFLVMPFSVFGVKGRLDLIDARLDEIQGEIRTLSLRLPESAGLPLYREDPTGRPPIPPAPSPSDLPRRPALRRSEDDGADDEARNVPRRARGVAERSEPRLDWPR